MDPSSTYVAYRAARRGRPALRVWLPIVVVLFMIVPLGILLLVGGAASTVTNRQESLGIVSGSCSIGGGTAAQNVAVRWRGAPLAPDQVQNVQTIVGVGRSKNVPPFGWVVAIAAAMQESTLRNLDHGDRDSLGLFQMRPSMGWGTPAQLTDPTYAATKFYDVLLAVPGWQSMSVTQAAQSVERSAFPNAYAQHEAVARALVADPVVFSASCITGPMLAGGGPGTPVQQRVVAAAMGQLGLPYSWGGGDWNGPTLGIGPGAGTVGFDCSGLTGYAWYQGSGGAVAMGTFTGTQEALTVPVSKADIQAGDLLHFPGHVGLYDGRGGMIHAPRTGTVLQVAPNILSNSYWMSRLTKIGRPKAYLAMTQNGAAPVAAAR